MIIILALLKATENLPEMRFRLVAKFCENEFEKLIRLFIIRTSLEKKLAPVRAEIQLEKEDLSNYTDIDVDVIETGFYLRQLDVGLFTLQLVDQAILILLSDQLTDDLKDVILEQCKSYGITLSAIKETVSGNALCLNASMNFNRLIYS